MVLGPPRETRASTLLPDTPLFRSFLDGEGGGERWLTLGGGATARSYGVLLQGHGQAALSPDCARERLRAAIPPPHLAFLRELKLFHERSEEHTSELQSLMRTSYAGFCLKKKQQQ